jgi:hypothetical protein
VDDAAEDAGRRACVVRLLAAQQLRGVAGLERAEELLRLLEIHAQHDVLSDAVRLPLSLSFP